LIDRLTDLLFASLLAYLSIYRFIYLCIKLIYLSIICLLINWYVDIVSK